MSSKPAPPENAASIVAALSPLRVYEFVNPSDAIVFDAPSPEVAGLAALIVGEGRCGARDLLTNESVIGLAIFGGDGGYQERYGRDLSQGLTALATEVQRACHSFRLKSGGERTSLNDWCAYAHSVSLKGAATP